MEDALARISSETPPEAMEGQPNWLKRLAPSIFATPRVRQIAGAGATVILAISIGAAGYFFFSTLNGNVTELAPVHGATSTKAVVPAPLGSSAPAQTVAPVRGDPEHAVTDLNNKIDYNSHGLANNAKGDFDSAIADFSEAIRLDPKYAAAYNNRGLAYIAEGDYDHAIGDFNQAVQLDPKYASAYNNRCIAHNDKGESYLALADCNEAIRLNPDYTGAYISRGVAGLYAGLLPLALADINNWTKLDPKSAYAALWLDIIDKRSNLPSYLADATKRIDMNKWPAPIVRLYLGQLTAEAVLIAVDDPDAKIKRGRVCEANFFTGELMLLQGKKDLAAPLFRLAAAECPKDFVQYFAANAELKMLGISLTSAAR